METVEILKKRRINILSKLRKHGTKIAFLQTGSRKEIENIADIKYFPANQAWKGYTIKGRQIYIKVDNPISDNPKEYQQYFEQLPDEDIDFTAESAAKQYNFSAPVVLLHEIGHILYYIHNLDRLNLDIKPVTAYALKKHKEGFAEAFTLFAVNPNKLKTSNFKLFQLITEIVK